MSDVVLDASAVLALLQAEPGSDEVVPLLPGALLGAGNAAEVVSKLADAGMPAPAAHAAIRALGLAVVPVDADLTETTGALRPATAAAGLSLGDRACLALAIRTGREAVTTVRAWDRVRSGAKLRVLGSARRRRTPADS